MNRLFFVRNNRSIHLYEEHESFECKLPEMNAIEIMVTILRARYEIGYIRERKTELYDANRFKTIEVIKKKEYGLAVCLSDSIIIVDLFDKLHLKYSISSFEEQCEIIYSFLQKNYGKGSVDYKIFSPAYLEHMLGADIPRIMKIEYTEEKIMSLMLYERVECGKPAKVRINEYSLYRKLVQGCADNGYKSTNHLYENNSERINNVMKEVKESEKIYPVVVYGGEDVVRDGAHRLACLFCLYGNIEVPVIRVYVDKPYYSYTMYKAAINGIEMDVIK